MDITGKGVETYQSYDRQNGEWVKAISNLNYLNKNGTEYLPGEIEQILNEDLEEVLKIWDKAQEDNRPLYREQIYQYFIENSKNRFIPSWPEEKVTNYQVVYSPYFSLDRERLQRVMDFVGYGEVTQDVYIRKNGQWLLAGLDEFKYSYVVKESGIYVAEEYLSTVEDQILKLPGDWNYIADEAYQKALELWDKAQKNKEEIYSKQFFPYLIQNYEESNEE
jgi:hypothetical protein